ncbi:MAG: DUF1080 domain-containing protein [Bryobacterales bacterium]|jgi:hypothetical protein|nr:DUF1080 domain-containing protein [Bryobacterales bacterium]
MAPSRRQLLRAILPAALPWVGGGQPRGPVELDLLGAGDLRDWVEEFHPPLREKAARERWSTFTLRDGVLRCDGSAGNVGFLRFAIAFCDFDLRFEILGGAGCNNGICFRAPIYENQTPAHTGYEMQLMWSEAKDPVQATGGLYSVIGPIAPVSLIPNQWNAIHVLAVGTRIRGWINQTLVQDYDQNSSEDTRNRPRCGYLSVQNHGGDTAFRNMRLLVVTDPAAA